MNPLTLVKRIQNINSREANLGISEEASWHAKYKDSAYVFVGGIPFDLTEGDLLAIFAQYGEIVDVNLVRDKGTGKSKGFAFVAYEDQRSTNLAVDNLNGAQILGRIIRVDHVSKYKKKEEEDEEEEQKKREARGVCRAFQKGECTRGAGCKFSHDEQRAANTGWGAAEDKTSSWGHDKFDGKRKRDRQPDTIQENLKSHDKDIRKSNDQFGRTSQSKDEKSWSYDEKRNRRDYEKKSTKSKYDDDDDDDDDYSRREVTRWSRHNSESYHDKRGEDMSSSRVRDYSPQRRKDEDYHRKSDR